MPAVSAQSLPSTSPFRNSVTLLASSARTTAAVKERGFKIDAIDYGKFNSWRPDEIRNFIPDVQNEGLETVRFCSVHDQEYARCPAASRGVGEAGHHRGEKRDSVLIQNGVNIEKPFIEAFPKNVVLSGISRMGANEPEPGFIVEDDPDRLGIAPFNNPKLSEEVQKEAAMDFVKLYSASGKAECTYEPDVQYARWRKLIYNCVWNPICALTDCDTGRLRLVALNPNYESADPVAMLVRPAMEEVIAIAASVGIELGKELVEMMIETEPVETYCAPSMLQDARKGRFMEVENILGEVVKTAEKNGVGAPVIRVLYGLLKARQWRTMERWGMVDVEEAAKKRKDMLEGKSERER